MTYLACLHCEKRFDKPSKRRYCCILCKNAVTKQREKHKQAADRYHERTRRQPVFDLTDVDCYRLEAAIASVEQHVFSGRGYRIKTAKQDADDWTGFPSKRGHFDLADRACPRFPIAAIFRWSAGPVQGGTTLTGPSTGRYWAAEKRGHQAAFPACKACS